MNMSTNLRPDPVIARGMIERPNYITPAGFAALRAEYDQLLGVERPAIVEVVSWAAGNGDRSARMAITFMAASGCARSTGGWGGWRSG